MECRLGRLDIAQAVASIIVGIVIIIMLIINIVKVSVGGLTIEIALTRYKVMPQPTLLDAPPLESVELISRMLLAWTITSLALIIVILWRPGKLERKWGTCTRRVLMGILGISVGMQYALLGSLARVVRRDIIPVLIKGAPLQGPGWVFLVDTPAVRFSELTFLLEDSPFMAITLAIVIFSVLLVNQGAKGLSAAQARYVKGPILILVLIAALALPVLAGAFMISTLQTELEVGARIIWYEDPGTENVLVDLGPGNQTANVTVKHSGLALAIIDNNLSSGVVVQRTFIAGEDYTGTPTSLNVSWTILGYKIWEDPADRGLVLGEVNLAVYNGTYTGYFFSFYVFKSQPDQLQVYYTSASGTGSCPPVNASEWGHNLEISVAFNPIGPTSLWFKVDGAVVCSANLSIDILNITHIGFIMGRYSYDNTYVLHVDNIMFNLTTTEDRKIIYERFEDGIDDIFGRVHGNRWWYDTYYTGTAGSRPVPPKDGSVSLLITSANTYTILNIETNLTSGSKITSWQSVDYALCDWSYTPRTLPVKIEELNGTARAYLWVEVKLNSTNFDGWNLLSPDGGDIYFTLPSGKVTLHRIASIDTTGKNATIYVLIPSLPSYSTTNVYMHYGGVNPYPNARVTDTPPPATGVRVIVQGEISPLISSIVIGSSGTPWTVQENLIINETVLTSRSSSIALRVNTSLEPSLGLVSVFAAIPPGSDANCRLGMRNTFQPSADSAALLQLAYNFSVRGGPSESGLSYGMLGLIAGRTGSGLDLEPDRIHWVYLNLTRGKYELRYLDGASIDWYTTGYVTVVPGNTLDLSALNWSERYALGPLLVFVNPSRATQQFTVTIRDIYGNDHIFTMEPIAVDPEQVIFDVLVTWEDLWWPNTSASLDNFIDHVIRLTLFSNQTARLEVYWASGGFLHMFMLNRTLPDFNSIPGIVEKYINNSYRLDPGDSVLYVKQHNDVVTRTSGSVWDPVNGVWRSPPLVFRVTI